MDQFSAVVTTDLHFTSKPQDHYRFDIFDLLMDVTHSENINRILILGDLTDAKDKHDADLVYRITTEIGAIAQTGIKVHILKGNHDYVDPSRPFFRFLNRFNNVKFHFRPEFDTEFPNVLFVPHTNNPLDVWHELDFGKAEYIFMHQTFKGAVASNGQEMIGLTPALMGDLKEGVKIFSGDIHVPQRIGKINYVGTPYHVHYGDKFEPQILVIRDDEEYWYESTEDSFPRKFSFRVHSEDELRKELERTNQHDFVKVKRVLRKSEFYEWKNIKAVIQQLCEEACVKMGGVEFESPTRRKKLTDSRSASRRIGNKSDIFEGFCKQEKIRDQTLKLGREFLNSEHN